MRNFRLHPSVGPPHAFLFTHHARARTLRVRYRRDRFLFGLTRRAILFGKPFLELNDFLCDET